jgi:hypothetical protein
MGITRARPTAATASAGQGEPACERSPISQNSMLCSFCSGATERISATPAPQPAATMTPVSSRRLCVQLPSPRARPNTVSMAASAPAKAPPCTKISGKLNSIAESAPTAAPPETPST